MSAKRRDSTRVAQLVFFGAMIASIVITAVALISGSNLQAFPSSPERPKEAGCNRCARRRLQSQARHSAGVRARLEAGSAILVRAEDAVQLEGQMVAGSAEDNRTVLNEAGRRALVNFIWAAGPADENHPAMASRGLFQVEVPQRGIYFVWARLWSEGPACPPTRFIFEREGRRIQDYVVQERIHKWWHWVRITDEKGLELTPGTYTIAVESQEGGAKLSRILLTTESYHDYIPQTPEG